MTLKFSFSRSIQTIAIFAIVYASPSYAQDLMYSQFNAMPLALNPAFAGNTSCSYRISAIYRNQWQGSSDINSYKSGSLGADFNIGKNGDETQNLWGFGVLANYEKTGSGTVTNSSAVINVAYHMRFGEQGNNFLSFGLQGGLGQQSFGNNFVFADEIDRYGRVTPNSNNLTRTSRTYGDFSFGAMGTFNPSDALNLYAGVAAFHLNRPNISFTNTEYKMPTRFNFHMGANYSFGDMYILPSLYVQYMQVVNWNAGAYLGKTLKAETDKSAPIIGYLGLWNRSYDAFSVAARFDISNISFIASYDIHTGGVANKQGGLGSPEFSINYFGCIGSKGGKRIGCPSL